MSRAFFRENYIFIIMQIISINAQAFNNKLKVIIENYISFYTFLIRAKSVDDMNVGIWTIPARIPSEYIHTKIIR